MYKLSDDLALVQTVDFFTPIVDDPVTYGRIAAANSLSDVYAMGGKPITALAIAAFPSKELEPSVLTAILKGAVGALDEAGASLAGGHTVDDRELKFGLSVTGTVHPDRMTPNSGARPGDRLILTKALGTGILTTALKAGKLTPVQEAATIGTMSSLNARAAECMVAAGCRGATDVTGGGLLGHGFEMAEASEVTLLIRATECPLLPGVRDLIRRRFITGADERNRKFLGDQVQVAAGVPPDLLTVLYDPQTSGGLLIAVAANRADSLLDELKSSRGASAIIGEVIPRENAAIRVEK